MGVMGVVSRFELPSHEIRLTAPSRERRCQWKHPPMQRAFLKRHQLGR